MSDTEKTIVRTCLRGDKELKSFDLHPGDYIAVFQDPNDGTFQVYSQIEGHVI